jgi:hypothetical protein
MVHTRRPVQAFSARRGHRIHFNSALQARSPGADIKDEEDVWAMNRISRIAGKRPGGFQHPLNPSEIPFLALHRSTHI